MFGRLISGTQIGVTLFFLISGFLLYRPFVIAQERGTRLALSSYARRRFFRIAPPYWVILTGLALWPGLKGIVVAGEAFKYYGFAQIYGHYDEGKGLVPAWSLCTEVAFYALLPLMAWALLRISRQLKSGPAATLVLLVVLVLLSALVHSYAVGHTWGGWNGATRMLPANLDWFALGMIVALISFSSGSLFDRARRAFARPVLTILLASALYVAMATRTEPNHLLQGIACFLVLSTLVLGPSASLLNRVLSTRLLTLLGLVSYSIFLLHDPLARWLSSEVSTDFLVLMGLTLALTLPLAALTYRLVELPSMRLGRAGEAKRRAAAGNDNGIRLR